ncbi:hypothetical protein CRENBAI_015416 [Crenichthys baileyi]|uniref:Uncharacterized protein n=1 Tax=Crenichthys baileyi TaxID=28760 RepID=A0AAV9SBA6_9TELE
MAVWRKRSPVSFFLSRYAPPLRRPVRHAGNGNESLFSAGFIILGDVRAAMSVELRMFNCATKMEDSNTGRPARRRDQNKCQNKQMPCLLKYSNRQIRPFH